MITVSRTALGEIIARAAAHLNYPARHRRGIRMVVALPAACMAEAFETNCRAFRFHSSWYHNDHRRLCFPTPVHFKKLIVQCMQPRFPSRLMARIGDIIR
jgi:hypothetical protein